MDVQATRAGRRYAEPSGILLLWTAVLAGPVAWSLGLSLAYALVLVACSGGSNWPMHLVGLGTLAMSVAGGWLAWREWRRTGSRPPGEEEGRVARARFMAALGILNSTLFSLAIVAQWIANFVLHPCMGI